MHLTPIVHLVKLALQLIHHLIADKGVVSNTIYNEIILLYLFSLGTTYTHWPSEAIHNLNRKTDSCWRGQHLAGDHWPASGGKCCSFKCLFTFCRTRSALVYLSVVYILQQYTVDLNEDKSCGYHGSLVIFNSRERLISEHSLCFSFFSG